MGRDPLVEVDLNVDDLLARVRYNVDSGRPHIVLNDISCRECAHRSCLYVCPVKAYQWQEDRVVLSWERCMECGACLHVCDREALSWEYPRGGFGVCFRLG
jgi:ferredoxin like protein